MSNRDSPTPNLTQVCCLWSRSPTDQADQPVFQQETTREGHGPVSQPRCQAFPMGHDQRRPCLQSTTHDTWTVAAAMGTPRCLAPWTIRPSWEDYESMVHSPPEQPFPCEEDLEVAFLALERKTLERMLEMTPGGGDVPPWKERRPGRLP